MEEENLRKIIRLPCRENQANLGFFVFPLNPLYFLFFSSFFFLTSPDEQFSIQPLHLYPKLSGRKFYRKVYNIFFEDR